MFIASDVFGRIPVPEAFRAHVIREDAEFSKLAENFRIALYVDGDNDKAKSVLQEMERRWGTAETKTRSMRWELLEAADEE